MVPQWFPRTTLALVTLGWKMANLTKRLVEALAAPAGEDLFCWDGELKGFGVRVKPSGVKSYVLKYRTRQGVARRFTFARHGEVTVEQARKRAAALLAEVRLGGDPAAERQEQRHAATVADLIDRYLKEAPASRPNKRPRSWQSDRGNLYRHVKPLLGKKQAASLIKADIENWQTDVANGKSAAREKLGPRAVAHVRGGKGAATRALASFRAMLSWGVERKIIPTNPALGVRPFEGRKCERFLSAEEMARLGDALAQLVAEAEINPHAAAIIRLLILTGCRKSEILTLQWPFVDFERACLRLPTSKTGAKTVQLGAPALEILAGLPRYESKAKGPAWVFPATRGDGYFSLPYKDWQTITAKAGLDGVRIHDLRHSFASACVADGVPLFITGKLLGHTQSRTTERYAHLGDTPLRAAADRTAKRLAEAMRGGGGKVVKLDRNAG